MRSKTLTIISGVAISAALLALVPDEAAAQRGSRGGGFRAGGFAGRSVAVRGFHRGTFAGRSVGVGGFRRATFASVGRPGIGWRGGWRGGGWAGRPIAGVGWRPGWGGGWRPGWGGGGWRPGWGGGGAWAGWRPGWGGRWGWGWPVAAGIAAATAGTWAFANSDPCWNWNGFSWVNTCYQSSFYNSW